MKKIRENQNHMGVWGWCMFAFLTVYALLLLAPYLIALISAFKTSSDFNANIFGITKPSFDSIKDSFTQFTSQVILPDGSIGAYDFFGMTINSFEYAVGGALCLAFVPCITAYCCARFKYFLSPILEWIVYITMAIPIVGSQASAIQMAHKLGIYNSIPGQWFMKCSFLGMYFLILHANFKSIPQDYSEAAYIDGAGNFSIFFKIMLPLVSNVLFLVFILQFVHLWSDYTAPLYFFPDKPTLAFALLNIKESNIAVPTLMAACLLISLPSLTLYICFTDKFTTNMQVGGIKG